MDQLTPASATQATSEWLRSLLASGRYSREPHDHIPHLEASRAIKDMTPHQAEQARQAAEALLRSVLSEGFTGWSDPWVLELIYLLPHVADDSIINGLTASAEKFEEEGNDVPLRMRQAILAALVDYNPKRDLAFWNRMANRGDQLGYAFSGMLGVSPMDAVELIPRVLRTPGPDRYCVLHLSLVADRLGEDDRSAFVSAACDRAAGLDTAAAHSVLEWGQGYALAVGESSRS